MNEMMIQYIKANSSILFRKQENNPQFAIFDKKGFWFCKEAQEKYDPIQSQPHLYIAYTKSQQGFYYVGKSNQPGGRWKRCHYYHLGTLAHHLLDTFRNDDQNHLHWIEAWMEQDTQMVLNENLNMIRLKHEVFIIFLPFDLYSNENKNNLTKPIIDGINNKAEYELIQYFLKQGKVMLNNHHNKEKKKKEVILKRQKKMADNTQNKVDCISVFVNNDQSAHAIIQDANIPGARKYSIEIFDFEKPGNHICQNYNKTSIPYKYFGNPDTRRNMARWRVIQSEMNRLGIKTVTIRLCPLI